MQVLRSNISYGFLLISQQAVMIQFPRKCIAVVNNEQMYTNKYSMSILTA